MKNWREYFIFIFFFIFSGLILGKIFYWQILRKDYYQALAFGLHQNLFNLEKRGEIFFRDGKPLALNRPVTLILIFPSKIQNKEKFFSKLVNLLDIKEDEASEIKENLEKGAPFSLSFDNLSEEKIVALKKENLEGTIIEKGMKRVYPQGEIAAQVVGFVNKEGVGQYGIEQYYDEILSKGEDLILTLDYEIQFKAQEILKERAKDLEFERGGILVLNPKTGEILAMASYPSFDPNFYQKEKDLQIFQNPFTQAIFEPGSTFKPVTMAIGLEEKIITPQTTYEDPGKIEIGGWIITNYAQRKYPGKITMTEVLEKSINTGAVFVVRQIPKEVFLEYLTNLGVFEKTGIDLPEIIFSNQELKKGREINFVTASFGQGISLTPIQLVKIFTAICNQGKMVSPYLVTKYHSNSQKQVFSKETTEKLMEMLISVVENGFAKRAKIKGYSIGGKTGTSLQPNFNGRGYSNKTWQSFVGCFPATDPEYLILVKLDNPQTNTAEYSAVPIFREIADFIIQLYQIPPEQ